jgi:hypothetical protein
VIVLLLLLLLEEIVQVFAGDILKYEQKERIGFECAVERDNVGVRRERLVDRHLID